MAPIAVNFSHYIIIIVVISYYLIFTLSIWDYL